METHNLLYDKGSQLWYELDIRQDLQKQNIRTMLSGWGGDEFLTNHGYAFYTQMLQQGKWIRFYKTLKARIKQREMSPKQTIMFLYKMVFIPILPKSIYCYLPKIKCSYENIHIFKKSFIPLVKDAYQNKTYIFNRYTSISIKADMIRAWKNGHVQSRLTSWSQESLYYKFHYTYPLLDRRLVEISFSYPTKYIVENDYDRFIYRKSIENIMPINLLWGIHKKEPKRWKDIKNLIYKIVKEYNIKNNSYTYTNIKDEELLLYIKYLLIYMK